MEWSNKYKTHKMFIQVEQQIRTRGAISYLRSAAILNCILIQPIKKSSTRILGHNLTKNNELMIQ